jgi:xylulokinase
MSVIGVDVGTNGCKAIAVRDDGIILKRSFKQYGLITSLPGWAELNPCEVWDSVKWVIKDVSSTNKRDPVKAISVSSMGDTITPCDEHLQPIHNSILAFDVRSIQEADYLSTTLGRKWIFEVTGQPAHPTYSATKILWLKNNRPEIFEKSAKFLCYEDFIISQLCGEANTSYSSAARTMLFDIQQYAWDPSLLEACSIGESRLAIPRPSGTVVAPILRELANELGIRKDVRIVVGGHDQPCGALGIGLNSKEYALDSTGTVEVLLVTRDQPLLDTTMLDSNICFWPHAITGEYCACGLILTSGAAFRWFRDELGSSEISQAEKEKINPYELITSRFPPTPTNLFFIPHLSGSGTPEYTPYAKGVLYGVTLSTRKYEIAKAILEGITFELEINIDLLKKAGFNINILKAVGGATNSPAWMQLKADITGYSVEASQFSDQCPLGAAVLASYGIGLYRDLKEAVAAVRQPFITYQPDEKYVRTYQQQFEKYCQLRSAVYDLYNKI